MAAAVDISEVFLPISNPKVAPHRFILVENVTIRREGEGVSIELPKGFLSDGCNQCIRAFGLEDWLIRDWMYATHQLTKTQTDSLIHGYDGHVCERHMQSDVAWAQRPKYHMIDPDAADELLRQLARSRQVRRAISWTLLAVVAVGGAVFFKMRFNKEKARKAALARRRL